MGRVSRGSVATVVGDEVSSIVVSSADVDVLNEAIVGLVNAAPGERHARMVYERWVRFSASPARQRPERELDPVLRAFAGAYRAAAGTREVSGRVAELAGPPVSLEVAGKHLDLELARVGQFGEAGASFMTKPWVMILGGLLAYKVIKKKGKK